MQRVPLPDPGRVNTIVEKWIADWGLTPEDTLIHALGNPGMIEDVKRRMMPRGFEVNEERFRKGD